MTDIKEKRLKRAKEAETRNERLSWELAADEDLLFERIYQARAILKDRFKSHFATKRVSRQHFDFANARVNSEDGKYFLQWQLRSNPNKKPDYYNQQTSVGVVYLYSTELWDNDEVGELGFT